MIAPISCPRKIMNKIRYLEMFENLLILQRQSADDQITLDEDQERERQCLMAFFKGYFQGIERL